MAYMGLDIGLKRIGVAYSPDGKIVTPLNAIERKNRNQAALEVKNAILEWNIDYVVIGIPLGGSSEAEMKRRIEHFMRLVDVSLPVIYQDESFSSVEAKELLKGEMKTIRDGRIDSLAAMIILQRYLENRNKDETTVI